MPDRLRAELAWARERSSLWLKKRLRVSRHTLPTDTPDVCRHVVVEHDLAVPMRDGIRLFADLYLPGRDMPDRPPTFPVVLIRMPYGKNEPYCYMPAHGRFWARKGFACVIQDVRGKFASEGEFEPYANEARDGWDTLDWIVAQPWCNGVIGMTGESYYGSTQWAVAALGHPNLRCLAPGDVHPDRYSNIHDGGVLAVVTASVWHFEMHHRRFNNHFRFDPWHLPLATTDQAGGRRSPWYQNLIAHPSRDAFWDDAMAERRYEEMTVPMMHWGGWYDVHTNGTIEGWRLVREQSRDLRARQNQWLVLGATDHELSPEFTGWAGRTAVTDHGYSHDRVRAFMEHWLKGVDSGFATGPRVRYYVTGAGAWRSADSWPPEGVRFVNYYLHGSVRAGEDETDGGLSPAKPRQEPADTYTYDPNDPVCAWLGRNVWEAATTMIDRREVERRGDVLVYSTPTLREDLEVTGPVTVTLFAATSARDTDFTSALVDVFPDGYAQLITEGIVRARYRESEREPTLVEPHAEYEYTIDLFSTSYLLPAGHRLLLEISSSNFDRYDRNLNTGGTFGRDTVPVVATQTVFHDAAHPSRLRLPVFEP